MRKTAVWKDAVKALINPWTFYRSFERWCFCYLCSLLLVEGCRQTVGLATEKRLSVSTAISACVPGALSTRVYGLMQRLDLSIPLAFSFLLIHRLLSLSVRAAFHLLRLPPDLSPFLDSNDPPFYLPCFTELSPSPRPSYPLPSPANILHTRRVSCVSVLSWTLFSSIHCLLFPPFSLISPVASLLSSPALPCSFLSIHVFPWSFPCFGSWHVQDCIF